MKRRPASRRTPALLWQQDCLSGYRISNTVWTVIRSSSSPPLIDVGGANAASATANPRWLKSCVSNQRNWDPLRPERSGVRWRLGELPQGPVVTSASLDGLSLHLLPAS